MYRLTIVPSADKNVTITVESAGGVPLKVYRLAPDEAMDTIAFLTDLFISFERAKNANTK